MGVASCLGIAGAGVVLLGTFALIGDQWRWFRRTFSRMSRRYRTIEKGLRILCGDSTKDSETEGMRCLSKGEPGFQEILRVIAERRPRTERAEISAICCGGVRVERSGASSVVHENVSLCAQTSSPPGDALTTREALEQWLHDACVRSLSHRGFFVVACGVFLGVVSLITQVLGSCSC